MTYLVPDKDTHLADLTAAKDRANHTGTQAVDTIEGLAEVATTGAYTDLAGLPTIPSTPAQVGAEPAGLSSTTSAALTARINSAVAALVAGAPAALDTLNELATALGNDPSFATTVTNALAAKAPLASPAFSGTVSGISKAMVGLGNVDNTADSAKPISAATQAALDGKYAPGDPRLATLNAAVGPRSIVSRSTIYKNATDAYNYPPRVRPPEPRKRLTVRNDGTTDVQLAFGTGDSSNYNNPGNALFTVTIPSRSEYVDVSEKAVFIRPATSGNAVFVTVEAEIGVA